MELRAWVAVTWRKLERADLIKIRAHRMPDDLGPGFTRDLWLLRSLEGTVGKTCRLPFASRADRPSLLPPGKYFRSLAASNSFILVGIARDMSHCCVVRDKCCSRVPDWETPAMGGKRTPHLSCVALPKRRFVPWQRMACNGDTIGRAVQNVAVS